ncbi:2-oxoisovalerate dehydrogenase subunit beta [Labeo rohita]|uniref:2-oxoisovalerate dehydrogenase subunit beta n=1 Tax=Labeo rohita TaxID=84645 RepID=A0ABQ8L2Q3_LABRO|nr:2-oxoisovalerate dehydrogenase subunit beta [Labeo rohita]
MSASCVIGRHLHIHTEVSRSWGRPFSARLFVPASDYYGNVAGTAESGYTTMPRVEQTPMSHLSPDTASSLKAPTLPSKLLRTTSVQVGKGYTATGQAGSCLHTMSVLQAYQADLLKELDESDEIRKDDITELRRTTDFSTVYGSPEKDRVFLLDAPLAPSGLFGDAINSVVDRYQEARKQAAAFQRYLSRRSLAQGAAGQEQHKPCTSSSYRASQKQSIVSRAPPQWDRDQRRSKSGASKAKPDLRVGFQSRKSSTKRAPVPPQVPPWDLAVVLEALCGSSFEPIKESSDRHLTPKTVLLFALTSLKRVEDLQALSVAPSYLDFALGMSKAFLYPRHGYVPKVPSLAPRPVVLQAFCPRPFRIKTSRSLTVCVQ